MRVGVWVAACVAVWVGAAALAGAPARGQSGVLLPGDRTEPDASVLSLEEMTVDVVINDGEARVRVTQIFANHAGQVEEGTYRFALPAGSTVSDFATWDGPVRVPAVVLERKRAGEVYAEARANAIDPGLLQAGEREGGADAEFTARIVPIPAYGTKRLELEYYQRLGVDRYAQGFTFPLKPTAYREQRAAHMKVRFELHAAHGVAGFEVKSKRYPLAMATQDAHTVVGTWEGDDVPLDEDFEAAWKLEAREGLEVSAFRNPHGAQRLPDESGTKPRGAEPGFFLAQTLIGLPEAGGGRARGGRAPEVVVALLDTSLSMQWEKLERSYAALEALLRGLGPEDRFSLLLFNQEVVRFRPGPVAATAEAVQQALEFVRTSRLRGGTDLGKAMAEGLAEAKQGNTRLYVFTDGNADRGETVVTGRVAAAYRKRWEQSATHPATNILAVGDDANLPLLGLLAENGGGVLESVLSTEPLEAKLGTFLAHTTTRSVSGLGLEVAPAGAVRAVYALDAAVYAGSVGAWVGQYVEPAAKVRFTARGSREGKPVEGGATVTLPAEALEHRALPRIWAEARVQALLKQMARDGETREGVAEVIELSRRYKFVTPYTSFLAVPRALLRPRVIRPGDPVLRVHTDPAITSVIAMFPFGLTKPLRHMASEDAQKGAESDRLWETRFLAPPGMEDGTYTVRLVLRDGRGSTYLETKSFVIASTTPSVRIRMERTRYHRGEVIELRVGATATTRTLTAWLEDAAPVELHWTSGAGASTGELRVPSTLAPGVYTLAVTAEDIAHNVGTQEVRIEVVP